MKNIKIRNQLLILGIILLIGIILILYSSYKVVKLDDLTMKVKQVDLQMLKLRKNEKDFLIRSIKDKVFYDTGKSKYLEDFKDNYSKALQLVAEIKSSDYINNNLFDLLNDVENSFDNYFKTFNSIVESKKEYGYKDWGLVGAMRTSIHEVEEQFKTLNLNDAFMTSLLMLRRHEKDFLLRKDLKYQNEFNTEISSLEILIKNDKLIESGIKNDLLQVIEDYRLKFEKLVAMDKIIGLNESSGKVGEMRNAIHEVEPLVASIVQKIQTYSREARRLNVIFTIFVIIGILALSIFAGYKINAGILTSLGAEPTELEAIVRKIAEGDLKIVSNDNEVGVLASVHKMANQLKEVIANINAGSNQIVTASREASSGSQIISEGASEQSASIEEVSATMEQITTSIINNANNAVETEQISKDAFESIHQANAASENSLTSIKNIADKISVINDIAFQTNILALNAAVEAARAGTQGKGFAVVASEVRKLAEKSKDAANEIIFLTKQSVEATQKASSLMDEVIPKIDKTSKLIKEISFTSVEQQNSSNEINNAVQQLNTVTQKNSALSEELAANSEELAAQAENLKEMVKYFRV
jgi:methyl-accepting chemotaxis protein